MRRILSSLLDIASSRALPAAVIGCFLLVYIAIAFFTDEALITLISLAGSNIILIVLLGMIPVNVMLRIVREIRTVLRRRGMTSGSASPEPRDLFDESVVLPALCRSPEEIRSRLSAEGYTVHGTGGCISAHRGYGLYPARLLFLTATFALFAGIIVSVTTRTSQRFMVIEGEPLQTPAGPGPPVTRIGLAAVSGAILNRSLTIETAPSAHGSGRTFGLYPPSRFDGSFVYPRYLGLAIHIKTAAPGLPGEFEARPFLNCYPPGREETVIIPDSPYRLVFSVPEPPPEADRYSSYISGDLKLRFRLLKGDDVALSGSIPRGGTASNGIFSLAVPDMRRLVVTDFVTDNGVILIWLAFLLSAAAFCWWLPVRLFIPRRELLLFCRDSGPVTVFSRAEGRRRGHAEVFHDLLDLIAAETSRHLSANDTDGHAAP